MACGRRVSRPSVGRRTIMLNSPRTASRRYTCRPQPLSWRHRARSGNRPCRGNAPSVDGLGACDVPETLLYLGPVCRSDSSDLWFVQPQPRRRACRCRAKTCVDEANETLKILSLAFAIPVRRDRRRCAAGRKFSELKGGGAAAGILPVPL